jgi:hypothetical protein
MRLGATVVFGTDELQVPVPNPAVGFRAPGKAGPAPAATPPVVLRPGDWGLEASLSLPVRAWPGLEANADLALSVKVDLAEALAVGADQAFLRGAAVGGPDGIGDRVTRTGPANGGGQRLQRLRDLAAAVRAALPARTPGWILHPGVLDDLGRFLTRDGVTQDAEGRAVDTFPLLRLDGADGGTLLGFPFLTSAAAADGNKRLVYCAADWQEAWIGLDPYLVTVGVRGAAAGAGAAAAGPDDVVITASMPLDFTLRRPVAFAWCVS